MRTVAIICTECSILNALLEYITMTALLEYLDFFIQIQVAEKWSNQLSPWVLPCLVLQPYILLCQCGTVMLFSNVRVKNSGCQNSVLLSLNC